MDTKGERGALDPNVVRSFMFQLLKVSMLSACHGVVSFHAEHTCHSHRESLSVMTTESCIEI
jgi:hypothetical protein